MVLRKCHWFIVLSIAALSLALTGCSDEDDSTDGDTSSADAYYTGTASAALGADGNEADCATCHSNDGSQDGYSGNTFKNIAYLTAYKGGDAPNLLAASNACVTGWMGGTALTEEDDSWKSLKAYLESVSDSTVTEPNALMPEVLADEAAYETAYSGGDAAAGEAAYTKACASCHDADLKLANSISFNKTALAGFTAGRIAQKVRTAGPPPSGMNDASDTTPGPMPFFEAKDVSATDLKNIIAYIKG